jgi:hypothetical protein
LRDWRKASATVSLFVCCAASFAQQTEHRRAIEAADHVLSTEEFSYSSEPSFWERAIQRFFEWLGGLVDSAGPSLGGIGQFIGILLICGMAVGAAFFIAYILSSIQRRRSDVMPRYGSERFSPPSELIKLSEEAEASGDYSRAFTLAFWAFLKLADEAGVAEYADDDTNWEIVATLTRKDLDADVRNCALLFDGIEYGHSSAGREDLLLVRGMISRLDLEKAA